MNRLRLDTEKILRLATNVDVLGHLAKRHRSQRQSEGLGDYSRDHPTLRLTQEHSSCAMVRAERRPHWRLGITIA